MFKQYEPNVKATIEFLNLLRVKVNHSTVNETLQNHPDWPSVLCITDSLNKWNIPNGVGKIDVNKIDQLPTPFIVYMRSRESSLAIVTQVTETEIRLYKKNYKKPITENKEDFLKKWGGIYLIAEPNEQSGETTYEAIKRKAFLNSLIPVAVLIAIIILPFLFFNRMGSSTSIYPVFGNTGAFFQYYILLAGIFVTSLLLWYEIDKNNPLLQKVCTGIKITKVNCNAILTGKHAKVFSWLSWSEVGFFYFAGGLLTLLLAENTIVIIAWINILALPYTVFSVYYQWRVAKQWCVLCLAVQALLVFGGINIIVNNLLYSMSQFSFPLFLQAALLYTLPILIWYVARPYFFRLQEAKNAKREYLRIKFNTEIFKTLLKKQKVVGVPPDDLGINIGNPAATNTIIKVCNPYCFYCIKAHKKIEALLKQNKNVKVKIIFKTSNNEADPSIKVVKHFLAIAAENNEERTKQALDDWYLSEINDYDVFSKNHKMNGELEKQGNNLDLMKKWCKEGGISATPTFFINGQQLPDVYNIEDLQYFLLE